MKFASVARLLAVGGVAAFHAWAPRQALRRAAQPTVVTGAILEDERSDEATPLVEEAGLGEAVKAEAIATNKPAEDWFAAAAKTVGGGGADDALLAPAREAGAEALRAARLPTRRDEPWRFSNLNRLYATRLVPPSDDVVAAQAAEMVANATRDVQATATIVFVDGQFAEEMSSIPAPPTEGAACDAPLFAGSVAELLRSKSGQRASMMRGLLEEVPERGETAPLHSANGVEALSALNTASLRDAAAVCAGAEGGASVVHAVFVATTAANDGANAERVDTPLSSPRLLVSVEEGATLQLLQTHLTLTSDINLGRHLTNSVTQLVLAEGSALDHRYDLCIAGAATHFDSATVSVGAAANYSLRAAMLGGAVSRVCSDIRLEAPTAFAEVDALSLASARQQLDLRVTVQHLAPDCSSEQRIRCVAGGRSEAIFKGRINVPQAAQRTDAQQLCRSLLLSDTATVNVMPSLEVVADDVSCTHGATVADLDGDALFYLLARGIPRAMARELLVRAFVAEVLGPSGELPPALGASVRARLEDYGAEAAGRESLGYVYSSV